MTTSNKKNDIQKLQRAIVDGLEDVKAQDIQVFDTEALSALFERVIVASGTSNRQTKALAASVRDAVREAGFAKPRIEGEGNGEWIIVDCGQAVVHIMQPSFRQYYNLEELWGEKPVRLKLGAAKPAAPAAAPAELAKAKPATTLRRSNAAKIGVAQAFPSKAQVRKDAEAAQKKSAKAASTKSPARKSAATATDASKPAAVRTVSKVVVPATGTRPKAPAKKAAAKKVAAKRPAAKAPRKSA
jgi:ribosome-associated protein